jgi:hypothetical protein
MSRLARALWWAWVIAIHALALRVLLEARF